MNKVDFLGDNAYVPKSKDTSIPRGIRNCNPLNIRYNSRNNWQGKYPKEYNNDRAAQSATGGSPEFEQFHFMWQGFLAAFKLIGNTYIYRYRLNTLSAIIERWAPTTDGNDPKGYLQKVCAWTGVGGQEPLSNHDPRLKNIVMAMAVVECGHEIKHYKADLDQAFEEYKPMKLNLYNETRKY